MAREHLVAFGQRQAHKESTSSIMHLNIHSICQKYTSYIHGDNRMHVRKTYRQYEAAKTPTVETFLLPINLGKQFPLQGVVGLFYKTLGLGMTRTTTDKLNVRMPALEKFLNERVDKLTTIVRMQYSWHTEVWKDMVAKSSTYIFSMLVL